MNYDINSLNKYKNKVKIKYMNYLSSYLQNKEK